jgi:hypothetical protein
MHIMHNNSNNTNSYRVTVSKKEYVFAVEKCKNLFDEVIDRIIEHSLNTLEVEYNNSYYFKITRKDKNNSFQICVSPISGLIELYKFDNNTKKSINDYKIHNSDDIMDFILNNFMIDCQDRIKLINISNILTSNFTNFNININNYTISMFEKNTNNGYYIYFDYGSYSNIGYICNNKYYNINSVKVDSINKIVNTLNKLIKNNTHCNIEYYNIINPMYIGCDLSFNSGDYDSNNNITDSTDDPV